jgi:hypothetical protein
MTRITFHSGRRAPRACQATPTSSWRDRLPGRVWGFSLSATLAFLMAGAYYWLMLSAGSACNSCASISSAPCVVAASVASSNFTNAVRAAAAEGGSYASGRWCSHVSSLVDAVPVRAGESVRKYCERACIETTHGTTNSPGASLPADCVAACSHLSDTETAEARAARPATARLVAH